MSETPLKRSPLHALHERLGARMVPFAGYSMPVQYSGILEEHRAVRSKAGLFDVSHMGEAWVEGPQATAFLDWLCSGRIEELELGQARYCLLLNEGGGCVDDILVYRFESERYLLCLNAANTQKDLEWLAQHCERFDCTVKDASADFAQLALQGPEAATILERCGLSEAGTLGYFRFCECQVDGGAAILARTGYTGEHGYELYLPPAAAATVAERLLEAGAVPTGLGARDSLRLEMGYPLYGHEIDAEVGPLEAGLGWAVKMKSGRDFLGRAAIEARKAEGLKQRILFFRLNDRRIAREGTPVCSDGKAVGTVRSGTFSPTLECPIGSALVEADAASNEDLTAEIRGTHYPLSVQRPPLVEASPQ